MQKINRKYTEYASALLLAACLVIPATVADAQDKFRMRVQAAVPSGSMSFEMLERFAERAKTMSAGRLDVRILGAGAIIPSPRIMDSVDSGVIEAGFAWPQFWSGKNTATALFSNTPVWPNSGLDQLAHFSWFYEGGGQEMYQQLLTDEVGVNVTSLFVTASGWQPLGWFNQEIDSLETFRSLRFRAPPGFAGEIFAEAGVSTTFVPGEEVIPSAERGLIDGAEWINPIEDEPFGFHQVFSHLYLATIHQFVDVGEVIINQQYWDNLPEDLQEILTVAARATIIDTYAADISRNAEALQRYHESGIVIAPVPDDVHDALRSAADRLLERMSAENEVFAQVVNHQREFADKIQPWWGETLKLYTKFGASE